jgi:arylsulfatase
VEGRSKTILAALAVVLALVLLAAAAGPAAAQEKAKQEIAKDWWTFEFWRFVFVQQEVAKLAQTAVDFPPMQPGASFNLEGVKKKIEETMANRMGK